MASTKWKVYLGWLGQGVEILHVIQAKPLPQVSEDKWAVLLDLEVAGQVLLVEGMVVNLHLGEGPEVVWHEHHWDAHMLQLLTTTKRGKCSWKVNLLLPLQCGWFPTWKPRGEGHWNGKVFFWGVSPEETIHNIEKICFTLNRLVFILAMELSILTPPQALSHFLLFSSWHYISSLSEPSVILKRDDHNGT